MRQFSAVALILAIELAVLTPVYGEVCNNTTIAEREAPGGKYAAVLFRRECGATTGYSTQISVVERPARASGQGNVFRADDDHGAAARGDWQGVWAEMTWLATDHLLIRFAEKARVFAQEPAIARVRITYEQVHR